MPTTYQKLIGARQLREFPSSENTLAEVLKQANRLMAVGCFCIGTNQVDLSAAQRKGIPVFNAPFSNTRSVAELTIAEVIERFEKFEFSRGIESLWALLGVIDKHIVENAPWKLIKSTDEAENLRMIAEAADEIRTWPEVLAVAPHRLIDIRDPSEPYSAAEFRADALAAMGVVAESAGVSPGLVMHHYGSWEGLRIACDQRVVEVGGR